MATARKPAAKKTAAKKAPAKSTAAKTAAPAKNNTKTVLIVVAVVVFIFVVIPAIALTAGGVFLGNKINDAGLNVDTTSNGEGSVNIKDKNGNEINVGGTQKLPAEFPSDIPLYDGKISASGKVTVDGKTGWTVTITTSDSLDTVSAWNTKEFSSNGWNTNLDTSSGSGGLLTATNGTYRVSAFSSNDDGTTTVLYTVTPESQE